MKKRNFEDDDGRRIADMSGLKDLRPHVLQKKKEPEPSDDNTDQNEEPLSKEELRRIVRSSMFAGLVLAMIFIAGAAILILFLLLIWGKL